MTVASLNVRLAKAHILGRICEKDDAPLRSRLAEFELTYHTGVRGRRELFLEEDGAFFLSPSLRTALTRPPTDDYKRWIKNEPAPSFFRRRKSNLSLPWEKAELPPEGFVSITVTADAGLPESRRVHLGYVQWGEQSVEAKFGL